MTYWLTKFTLTPILRLLFRVRSTGGRHVPRSGPAILACNHLSFCDSLFVPAVLRRRISYLAKAEYFDNPRTAWYFQAVGHVPVRRGAGSDWRRALDAAAEVLEGGRLLGIYPEGTRSVDGRLHRGHTGIALLALRTGVPVIPVGIRGTQDAQPIGARFLRPFAHVDINIGPPLDFSHLAGRSGERRVLREVTDTVMAEIQLLSGQEVAGRFAPRRAAPSPPAA